eukprot:COSAG04_NODE_18329_length_445_cov_0.910405_1_plen_40_part_10
MMALTAPAEYSTAGMADILVSLALASSELAPRPTSGSALG